MIINRDEYRDRVLGCWLGKNIGGTLGEPFEWRRQLNDVSFYTRDLGGKPMPNDDLDIQLLWLIALEEQGIDLDSHVLAEYWVSYVTPHWSEYGTAKVNLRLGLLPPLSGSFNNEYKDSCGAFIRSEIWACIAPGCPQLSARYAYEDAIIDHGNGEGTYAAVFTAAMESAAFVEHDVRALTEIGLSYIPGDCGVAGAVRCVLASYDAGLTWVEARDELLEHYRGGAFMGRRESVSPRDLERGFDTGKRGWDAPSNVGIVILALLYGEGDFGRTVCTAVNCGEDTDCTAATAGALYGILRGATALPQRWVEPIGRGIVTITLNLGDLGHFGSLVPATVDELTERTQRLAEQVLARHGDRLLLADMPTDLSEMKESDLISPQGYLSIFRNPNGPIFRFPFFEIWLDYGETPLVLSGLPKTIRVTICNTYRIQANLHLRWHVPNGWIVRPAETGLIQAMPSHLGPPATLTFALESEHLSQPVMRFVLEIAVDSRPSVMCIPVTLVSGDLVPG